MNKLFLSIILTLPTFFTAAQDSKKPKLVVGVIVDQMRYEYLYRFENHYGEGGFKRLLSDGFSFRNAHYNYIPTYTGPGHASVYTGTTPRVHGIIANDWYDKYEKRSRYCAEDEAVKGVGGEGKVGMRSPKNLKTTSVTDELRLFYQNRSKVVGIALKDRGAILPAGHQPNGAYWFDAQLGNFITSTFYMQSLPKWVEKFNKRNLARKYMSMGWDTYKPIETYIESARDDRPYESKELNDQPVFPYDFSNLDASANLFELIKVTPHGNTITTEMALAAIEGEELGEDEITDFLAVSYSSPDYAGHAFGPYSKEIQDIYIRLDLELERLMKELDEKVGKGNWTMFLTADHAVADIPAYLKELGHETDYVRSRDQKKLVWEKLEARFGTSDVIENVSNHQIFLNREVIAERNLEMKEVKSFLITEINQLTGISAVFDGATISNYGGHDLDVKLIAAGLNAHMSGDIIYTDQAGWLGQYHLENGGTTHGSGYSYDTHVPMIFYGWGIKKGSTVNYHPITDIAPTISTLLNIKLPSGCTGQPAPELLD